MKKKQIKVLLVEDDKMIVDMYKMRLEEEGYEIIITDKGSEALEIAKEEKPDVILLDVILPEVDGFTILDKLKSQHVTKDIPVLMLTNLGQEADKDKGREMGADDYFVKSQHTPAEVLAKIKELINKE
ncbi:MAG: response regulator [bacterium]